jgi:hypothetical protein
MKKFLLAIVCAVMFTACYRSSVTQTPTLQDGVYGALVYVTKEPTGMYIGPHATHIVVAEMDDGLRLCTSIACYDSTTLEDQMLTGILHREGTEDGCAWVSDDVLVLYPTNDTMVEGWNTYDYVDCNTPEGDSWHMEAYVHGVNIKTLY